MALKLKTKRKAQWIKVLEDRTKPEGKKNPVLGMFKVIPLTPSELHDLYKDHESDKWSKAPDEKAEWQRESSIDKPVDFIKGKAKKIIIDWEDITTEDEDGNDISLEFSLEMLDVLYELNPDVISYVLEKADKLSSIFQKAEEDEVKN